MSTAGDPPSSTRPKKLKRENFFTKERKAAVMKHFGEFDAMVKARPYMNLVEEAEVKAWKGQWANFVLDTEAAFSDCSGDGEGVNSRAVCFDKILEMFKNHYQYYHQKDVNARRAALNTPPSNSIIADSSSTVLDAYTQDEISKIARDNFMGLVGEFGPCDYFILHNDEAIAKMQVQIEASAHPGCPPRGGGLLKAAQSRAWEECEDKERYEEMARNHDPELVRGVLPSLLCVALKDLLKRDVAGTLAIKTALGYRKPDGSISASMISVAYDTSTKHFLDFSMTPQEFHAEEAIFSQQVDKVLPSVHNITMVFPLNENQIPLWNVDSAKATPMQLTEAARQFLAALWVFSFRSRRPIPPLPYSDLESNPSKYFDTSVFTLPAPFKSVKPADLYLLADFFDNHSKSSTPFQFYEQGLPVAQNPVIQEAEGPEDGEAQELRLNNMDDSTPLDLTQLTSPNSSTDTADPASPLPKMTPTTSPGGTSSDQLTHAKTALAPALAPALTPALAPISDKAPLIIRLPGGLRSAKRKPEASTDMDAAPPKQRRKTTKRKDNVENQPPMVDKQAPLSHVEDGKQQPPAGRSLRRREGGKAIVEKPKSKAPSSQRVPASQRWFHSNQPTQPIPPAPAPAPADPTQVPSI
ncbi:hypothetical protein FA13DRAFT_1788915 [Coprinellus micaceus]|uniref:Uncharacterized protein n=1 Tax=Coprinellus micaceus TaxID=71717 RepID=A0A4Y7TJX0_COPMI|nr:hypothetical protein FA13DRAFT_1788915 [Coprinellus micaceus]